MQNLAIAYMLIAFVLAGYSFNLRRRAQAVERERKLLESQND